MLKVGASIIYTKKKLIIIKRVVTGNDSQFFFGAHNDISRRIGMSRNKTKCHVQFMHTEKWSMMDICSRDYNNAFPGVFKIKDEKNKSLIT